MTMTFLCRNATTFGPNGELDEEAFRNFLLRFVDAKIGVCLASGGTGEGHTLSLDELSRVYRIAAEVGRGHIVVASNQPEQYTANGTIAQARLAVDAGVDMLVLYGPSGWHGFQPTDEEYLAYFDEVLAEIKHPVALCPNRGFGYPIKASVLASICHKYPQVSAIILSGLILEDDYFLNIKDSLKRRVDIYVATSGSINMFSMGANGLVGIEANFIPKTVRQYIDAYEAGSFEEAGLIYADIRRVLQYTSQWKGTSPRWIKMAMKSFKLPGGEGGLRKPYVMADDAEVERFTTGAIALDIPEINEMARSAGLL